MIRDYQAIMKTWFPVGQQRIIPTYGKHEGVKLVGCLDYSRGKTYIELHEKYDAAVFLKILKNVNKLLLGFKFKISVFSLFKSKEVLDDKGQKQ